MNPQTFSKRAKEMIGQRFDRLLVVERGPNDKKECAQWHCICDCGNRVLVRAKSLLNGHNKSCGCLRREMTGNLRKIHGLTKSTEFVSWSGMIGRCTNPKNKRYSRYGGRGITVCQRWREGEKNLSGFECFLTDMLHKPSRKHSIDRIDNDGNYEPSNCRWATSKEQAANR